MADERDPYEGAVLEEVYRLVDKIGEGGTAFVYRAEHLFEGEEACIKLLKPEHCGDPLLEARFEREGEALGELAHPNIVEVIGYGEVTLRRASGEEEQVRAIMSEFVPGRTLFEYLYPAAGVSRLGPPGSPRRVHQSLSLLRQIARGLRAVHARGLLHRDVKPANLLVYETRDGVLRIKLTDFGIVKASLGAGASRAIRWRDLLPPGKVTGTPGYMSPEQLGDGHLTPSSDLYALGAVAYELVTGQRPFDVESPVEVLAKHVHQDPEPPNARVAGGIGCDGLSDLVLALLAKAPTSRPSSAEEVERELVRIQTALLQDRSEPTCSLRDTLEEAVGRRDMGVVVELVEHRLRNDAELLLAAGTHLRNAMAYEDARTALQLAAVRAAQTLGNSLGQLALCLARSGAPAELERAEELLGEAERLAGRETLALQARLAKQRWCLRWQPDRLAKAWDDTGRKLLRRARALYVESFRLEAAGAFAAINAVTLLALEEHLVARAGARKPSWRGRRRRVRTLLSALRDDLSAPTMPDEPPDAEYWKRATRLELLLVRPRQQATLEEVAVAVAGMLAAPKVEPFMLDSTIQQLEMLRRLEFRPQLVESALEPLADQLRDLVAKSGLRGEG